MSIETPQPVLMIWMRISGTANNRPTELQLQASLPGFVEPSGSLLWSESPADPPSYFQINNFPRRQRELRFEITGTENGSPVPTRHLRITNPEPFTGPSWKRETLPAVRLTNGSHAALTDFVVRQQSFTGANHSRRPPVYTAATLKVETSGHQPLKPIAFEISDPAGNRFSQSYNWTPAGGSPTDRVRLERSLLSDDPVWHLKFEIESPPGPETTEDIVFANIPVSTRDNRAPTDVFNQSSRLIPGLKIEHVRVTGFSETRRLWFWIRSRPSGVRIRLVDVRDDRGNPWSFGREGVSEFNYNGFPPNAEDSIYELISPAETAEETRFLTIRFRVFRTTFLEFFSAPHFETVGASNPIPTDHSIQNEKPERTPEVIHR